MLWYKTFGSGKNIVLLHGWGFNARIFKPLAYKLAKDFKVTIIDLPGHGKSDIIKGGIDKWSEAIMPIMPNNATIIGWSLGGLLAIKIATLIGIKNLLLVASSPKFVKQDKWQYGIDRAIFSEFSQSLNINIEKTLKRFIFLQTKEKKTITILNNYIDNNPADPYALEQGLDMIINCDLIKEFLALNCDKSVVLGKYDTIVPNKIANFYKENNIATHILNCGHIPFLDSDFLRLSLKL